MAFSKMVPGSELRPEVQRDCLRRYVHRYTREHVPDWSRKPRHDGSSYPVQFASDADWLAHTLFTVKADGTLDERARYCHSSPTWPDTNGVMPK
jgi:hypothetical protein